MTDSQYLYGVLYPENEAGEFNALQFFVNQLIADINTATLVKIISCTNSGGLSAVGSVDVQPLVNHLDARNQALPSAIIYDLPYVRLQGGKNAFIMDPEPGDIGIAVFASRDISSVKANKAQANPGSFRRFDWADGLYIGGVLNGVPSQYVQFSTAGIKLYSPAAIEMDAPKLTINAPTITITGDATLNGTLTVSADVVIAGKSVVNHNHTDPQGGTTGPMQN